MKIHTAASTFLIALLALGGFQAAVADATIGGTTTWTEMGAPTMVTLQGSPAWVVSFHNDLTVSVLGIVILVLHNSLGQTVYYTTASMTLTSLGLGSVYVVVAGVPPGSYNARLFAFDPSGVPISAPTSATFVVS